MPPAGAGGKAPGAAAPGPPLGVEKESRADVRVRVRRGVARVEVEKAGIAAVAPVATDMEDTPARVVVGVENKPSAHGADSPGGNYTSGLPRIRKNGRK